MAKKYVDLHMHSRFSDGEFSPAELVRMSASKGLDVIAITDHDMTEGYFEAKCAARGSPVLVIPGVEISTPNYHFVTLGLDVSNKTLQEALRKSREVQRWNFFRELEELQKEGVPITDEKVSRYFVCPKESGNTFLTMMYDPECKGYLAQRHGSANQKEIFDFYFGREGIAKRANSKNFGIAEKEAVELAHGAGGLIGIAHPIAEVQSVSELENLMGLGIDFLEVNYDKCGISDWMREFARTRNIPLSYGSDFHGIVAETPFLGTGENVLTERMKDLLNI